MNNPTKKERKQRIKTQNAQAKAMKAPDKPLEPITPERRKQLQHGMWLIITGFLEVLGIDPDRLKKPTETEQPFGEGIAHHTDDREADPYDKK